MKTTFFFLLLLIIGCSAFNNRNLEYDLNGQVVRIINIPDELEYNLWLMALDENCYAMYKKIKQGMSRLSYICLMTRAIF